MRGGSRQKNARFRGCAAASERREGVDASLRLQKARWMVDSGNFLPSTGRLAPHLRLSRLGFVRFSGTNCPETRLSHRVASRLTASPRTRLAPRSPPAPPASRSGWPSCPVPATLRPSRPVSRPSAWPAPCRAPVSRLPPLIPLAPFAPRTCFTSKTASSPRFSGAFCRPARSYRAILFASANGDVGKQEARPDAGAPFLPHCLGELAILDGKSIFPALVPVLNRFPGETERVGSNGRLTALE